MRSNEGVRRSARAWKEAWARFAEADRIVPLDPPDLERLAISSYLSGGDEASWEAWTRAHHEHARRDETRPAARCGFWLVLELLSKGEWIRALGWIETARGLLDDPQHECAERGLVLVLDSRRALKDKDLTAAHHAACEAIAIAERCDDPDLAVFARLALGVTKASMGDVPAAAACFDELLVRVMADGVSAMAVGTAYCAVIEVCHDLADVARARVWTAALSAWCASQPELVPFRGHCLVYRVETMRLTGEWSAALSEAGHVCRASEDPRTDAAAAGQEPPAAPDRTVGAAFYEVAEILRMRGRFTEAEETYRQASFHGRPPEPGLALLRLAQRRLDAAQAAVRRLLAAPQKPSTRATVLASCAEVMIAAGDLEAARSAVHELEVSAQRLDAPLLRALSAQASGALRLAEGDPQGAFTLLRDAWMEWQALEAPYEAARARVLMGLACRDLGDAEAAEMEFDAARRVFVRLEARPETERVEGLLASSPRRGTAPLTRRELQVIRLVAAGRTNRAIARELTISERTVDRHVSNILTKLGLPSRSAATAFAHRQGLV